MKKMALICLSLLAIIQLTACEKLENAKSVVGEVIPQIADDRMGKLVINPQFNYGNYFYEGLAAVRIGDAKIGKYGFIDKNGKMVVNSQYAFVEDFSEGLASVGLRSPGKTEPIFGFIDNQGKEKMPAQFEGSHLFDEFYVLGGFSEGLAVVKVGGTFGYISRLPTPTSIRFASTP